MAFAHTPGVLSSIELFNALLAFYVDCIECGIEKGIIQEVKIVYRKVDDKDLDAGVHRRLAVARSEVYCITYLLRGAWPRAQTGLRWIYNLPLPAFRGRFISLKTRCGGGTKGRADAAAYLAYGFN